MGKKKKPTKKPESGWRYKIPCHCSNCGCDGVVLFRKGVLVPDTFSCPNCECRFAKSTVPTRKAGTVEAVDSITFDQLMSDRAAKQPRPC